MEKRQRSVSLSFLLLRFVFLLLGSMLLCGAAALALTAFLERQEIIYPGHISNQQVEEMLAGEPEEFVPPGENFLAEYALFGKEGRVLESNVEGKTLKTLETLRQTGTSEVEVVRYSYADGSELVLRWHYRKEFANPALRKFLPPFEALWWLGLLVSWVLCLLLHTLWLGRRLAEKLQLFSQVSEKVAAQELDFTVPRAGIREYDKALAAMEHMREALYEALSAQWAAVREREAEIAALAHDLKTPLTLIGGNAELLLEEELSPGNRKMVETIASAGRRARQYVTGFLEISAGEDEPFEKVSLEMLFEELGQRMLPVAEAAGVCLQMKNHLSGRAKVQRERLLRAFSNVVQNGVEHTPEGGNVYLEGIMPENGWKIVVRDEGGGFDSDAIKHAAKRLWRGDGARQANGHNGLGLWFASEVIKAHGGTLELDNEEGGGKVTMTLQGDFR